MRRAQKKLGILGCSGPEEQKRMDRNKAHDCRSPDQETACCHDRRGPKNRVGAQHRQHAVAPNTDFTCHDRFLSHFRSANKVRRDRFVPGENRLARAHPQPGCKFRPACIVMAGPH